MSTYYNIQVDKTQAVGTHLANAQVDNYLKVEFDVSAENTLIDSITKAAEEQAEEICNLCINQKDVTLYVSDVENDDDYAAYTINLPYRGTVSSLVVKTTDEGTETTVDSDNYFLKNYNQLVIKNINQVFDSILITYTVAPRNLPIGLDVAMLKLCADYYVNRTNDSVVGVTRISESTRAMLTPFEDTKAWI